MDRPLVSVLVATYNQVAFVAEMVESVLAQSYPNVEIVVSDDGSTDGTAAALRELTAGHANVRLLLNEQNAGISGNCNRLLRAARGDYLAWLAGDDLMMPGKLERQVEALQRHPAAVSCFHDAEVFDSDGATIGLFSEFANGTPGVREGGVELLFDPTYKMLPSTMMFRADAWPRHGFDENLRYANDWLFTIEVFVNGPCVAIDEPLARYRRHPGNVTQHPAAARYGYEEGMAVMDLAQSRYPDLAGAVRGMRCALLLGQARRDWGAGRRRRAIRSGLRAAASGGAPRLARALASGYRRRVSVANSSKS
jgi:glycosyltransferase involved in cell wall biosynthesis